MITGGRKAARYFSAIAMGRITPAGYCSFQ